jgi:hypothetical protein
MAYDKDIKLVNKPRELVTLTDKTVHPRSLGGEVHNQLMSPKPLLEKINDVFLIVLALRAGTTTRKKEIRCQSDVQEGRVMR